MNDLPKEPIAVELEAGREYWWCACGKTGSAPWCDGSHEGTDKQPMAFRAQSSGVQYICQCRQTAEPPFCDGTHERL